MRSSRLAFGLKPGRKMKRVDVIGSVFLDQLDQIFSKSGENRSDRDDGCDADDDAEDR